MFETVPSFNIFFYRLKSSTETNSGILQNACRSRCLITPLYRTLNNIIDNYIFWLAVYLFIYFFKKVILSKVLNPLFSSIFVFIQLG